MSEAIAVTSVIGNSAGIPTNWFSNADTIGSRIASEVINTTSPLWQSGIFYLAAILLVIGELIINLAAQLLVRRCSLRASQALMAVATEAARIRSRPVANLPRRQLLDRIMRWSATGAALLAVFVLGVVIYSVVKNGEGEPLLGVPHTEGADRRRGRRGIAPFIIGTLLIVGAAAVVAVPLGVLIAIFLTEYSNARTAFPVRLALDLLNGLPTIVIGMFLFGLLVLGHQQSGFAASLALAIIIAAADRAGRPGGSCCSSRRPSATPRTRSA